MCRTPEEILEELRNDKELVSKYLRKSSELEAITMLLRAYTNYPEGCENMSAKELLYIFAAKNKNDS